MFFPFSAMQVFNMLALLSLDYLHKRGILPLILYLQKNQLETDELSYRSNPRIYLLKINYAPFINILSNFLSYILIATNNN